MEAISEEKLRELTRTAAKIREKIIEMLREAETRSAAQQLARDRSGQP